MNLILYIQLTEHQNDVKFRSPIVSKLKEKLVETFFYDIDNHSESFIVNHANRLLHESVKKIILIESESESNFLRLMSLLTNLLDNSEGVEIFFKGHNQKLEKMISIFTYCKISETTPENDIIEQILGKFL